MEPLIEELSDKLLIKLAGDDKEIAVILSRIDDDEVIGFDDRDRMLLSFFDVLYLSELYC